MLCLRVCLHTVSLPGACHVGTGSPGATVSSHVGPGNWTQILCNKCSFLLSHHSSPSPWILHPLAQAPQVLELQVCTIMPGWSGMLPGSTTLNISVLQHTQNTHGSGGPRRSCLYRSRTMVRKAREVFLWNSSLTCLVPLLRTPNRAVRLSWKIPRARVFSSHCWVEGRQDKAGWEH